MIHSQKYTAFGWESYYELLKVHHAAWYEYAYCSNKSDSEKMWFQRITKLNISESVTLGTGNCSWKRNRQ
jgi:hypothetical protein